MKRIKSLILALAATTVMLWGQTEVSTPIVPSWERPSEGATVISLSLQQAKDTAIRYNRQLQNASYDVKIAQAQRWQTIASMLPQVTAGYDYQNMMGFKMEMRIPVGKNPATGEDMVNVIERASPPNGTFSISAGMQISGQQIVGAMINKIAVDMADISRLQTEQTITSTVTQLYISILANRHIVNLLDSSKVNIEKIYQSTVEAVKIGVTEQTEADKLYVQVMKLESALNSARQGLEMTYSSMKLQLGVSADTYIELTDNLDQLTNAEASLRLLHTKFDITDNYNYRLMSKNLELSRKQIKLAAMGYSPSKLGYIPQVILSGRNVNNSMAAFIASKVMKLMINKGLQIKDSNILLLGFTFKENCPDIRNTKVIDIYRELKEFGVNVDIYDDWVDNDELFRKYGVKTIEHIDKSKKYNAVILAVPHNNLKEFDFEYYHNQGAVVFDVKAVIDRRWVDGRL